MTAKLFLYNYRCFTAEQPAVIEIAKGFTAFIGPNNSGKSTILKAFWELRPAINLALNIIDPTMVIQIANGAKFGVNVPAPVSDPEEVVYENATEPMRFEITLDGKEGNELCINKIVWVYTPTGGFQVRLHTSFGNFINNSNGPSGLLSSTRENITCRDLNIFNFQEILEVVKAISDVQYIGSFRNALNEGAGTYFDLQLGTSFLNQWHQWKTGASKQQNRAVGRVTEDVRRLIGAQSLEINASTELKTLQVVIDKRPHKLSELGAGISQLIVVLANALIKRPKYIAIDEPETHLHPALQLDFLTTLASYAERGVFYSTHSIGLARASADLLYSVRHTTRGSAVRLYERTPQLAEFLGSMGIAGLQEIGWDRVLLVEGSTDVRTYQQFLRTYGLDQKTIVIPMGGSSMINGNTSEQLAEIRRLSETVFAVIDSELDTAGKQPAKERLSFKQNCEALNIDFLITERRATENYFSTEAIKKTFGDGYSALEPHAKPGSKFWGKTENWRIAMNMTIDEMEETDVGRFLSRCANNN